MSNQDSGEAPPNFLRALYGDLSDEDEGEDVEFFEDSYEEEDAASRDSSAPLPPTYSPLTIRGSSPAEPLRVGRDRSRSPIGTPSSSSDELDALAVVRAIYDEGGELLQDFFVPDSHALYESGDSAERHSLDVSSSGVTERGNSRGRSLSGRARGGRRGEHAGSRGQSRGRRDGRRSRQPSSWEPGQPLQEIWLTGDDVPFELREMVRDVLRRRQARVAENEARRNARRINESEINEEDNSLRENGDVFEDATDGRGNTLLEGVDLHFEWSPMETFRGVEETFTPERTGSVSSYNSTYDAFRSYWDDGILQTIVEETNRYASRLQSAPFQSEWYPTNAHEILCLFAFWMMTGIIRMPTISSYFSNSLLLKTEVFSRITTLKRYTHLHRALHFVDTNLNDPANPTKSEAASFEPLHRLNPIIEHLNSKFKSNYVLSKDICIDKSLTLWKGRLKFKQYIRSQGSQGRKAAKFGIKTFELCESTTGYLWSFLVYTGNQNKFDLGIAKSTAVVLKLIEPLLNKGYRLFMDNWFNSPMLARILKRNKTDCVGTLGESHVPSLLTHVPLKQGQLVARHSGDVCVLSRLDKKRVNMISTCHGSATALPHVSSRPNSRPEPFKPQSILDYNRSMGGVDIKDQMLEPYLLERKRCAKWYLKLFKRLLNISILNSCILLESSLNARQDNFEFRLELVHAIFCRHLTFIPLARRAEAPHSRTAVYSHIVHHTHWPVRVPLSDKDRISKRNSRQKCALCLREGRKTQRTPYMCEDCQVPLCVEDCFKTYHTSV